MTAFRALWVISNVVNLMYFGFLLDLWEWWHEKFISSFPTAFTCLLVLAWSKKGREWMRGRVNILMWTSFFVLHLLFIYNFSYVQFLAVVDTNFVTISYPMIGYYGSAYKVFWYFYTILCSLLSFNYLGMLLLSLTLNFMVAEILASAFYTTFNLFAGFLIPKPVS